MVSKQDDGALDEESAYKRTPQKIPNIDQLYDHGD